MLEELKKEQRYVITFEDGVLNGGFGEKIALYCGDPTMKVICRGIPKEFLSRYDAGKLQEECRLTSGCVADDMRSLSSPE